MPRSFFELERLTGTAAYGTSGCASSVELDSAPLQKHRTFSTTTAKNDLMWLGSIPRQDFPATNYPSHHGTTSKTCLRYHVGGGDGGGHAGCGSKAYSGRDTRAGRTYTGTPAHIFMHA